MSVLKSGALTRHAAPLATVLVVATLLLGAIACDRNAAPAAVAASEGGRISKGIGPEIGYTAPDFTLMDLYDRPVHLSDYRGQVVVLNFWATWCGPCRIEMPTLQALHEDMKDRPVSVLGVAGDIDGKPQVAPFVEQLQLTFPSLIDAAGTVQDRYFVNALPMTFLIDRDGIIVYKLVGFFDWHLPTYRGLVEKLAAENM
ncbi:MAG: peroxiredoxin family protein [Leptospirillia bacterium]